MQLSDTRSALPVGVAENHDGELGLRADAEPLYLRALDTLEWELGPYHRDVIVLRTALAGFYQTERRYAEADPLYREVLAILRSSDDADPDQFLTVLDEYAALLRAAGRETEAEPFATEARAIRDAL